MISAALRGRRSRMRDVPFRLRGGSWNNNSNNCRSAHRNDNQPGNNHNNNGLRVVVGASTLIFQNWWEGFHRA